VCADRKRVVHVTNAVYSIIAIPATNDRFSEASFAMSHRLRNMYINIMNVNSQISYDNSIPNYAQSTQLRSKLTQLNTRYKGTGWSVKHKQLFKKIDFIRTTCFGLSPSSGSRLHNL
jgi:hypothetical protein